MISTNKCQSITNIIFVIAGIAMALYAVFAYGILTEWAVSLGKAVH